MRRATPAPRLLPGSILAIVLAALLAAPPSMAGVDGDGVPDAEDNCVEVPNAGQQDANAGDDDDSSVPGVQHYGDACDADLDDDGTVGASDFFSGFRPCLGLDPLLEPQCAVADLDGDGIVGSSDFFTVLRPAFGLPPGPGVTEPAPTLQMLADQSEGYMSFPWPNDTRFRFTGTIDLVGFPGTAENILVNLVLQAGAAFTTGFGSNSPVLFTSSATLDAASLPAAGETLADDAVVMLVNLDDPTTARTPVILDFKEVGTTFRPDALLAALPYPGHALPASTRHALLVFDGLLAEDGQPLGPSPLIQELEQPFLPATGTTEEVWNALQDQRADVLAYIAVHTSHAADDLRAFTVFTTQDTTGEMQAIAAAVDALPAPSPVSLGTADCSGAATRATVSGSVDLPRWQAGAPPFLLTGGSIVVGLGGLAVQQGTENAVLEVTLPCGEAPAEGWPILLFMDGTGGDARSRDIPYLGDAALPYVVASIAPLYSGDREFPGQDPATLFFNLANPLAARTNQIQQAADMIFLRRVAQGLSFSAAETASASGAETDDARVAMAGHSQGAVTLPITLAFDAAVGAGFLSAGGAGLYHAILHRADLRTQVEQLVPFAPGELDPFHPVLAALQTIAEIGDSANYTGLPQQAHILSVGGLRDGCSPWETISHLGTGFGLEQANATYTPTFGDASLEPPLVDFPVSANLADGRTGVTVQLDTSHFGSITNPSLGVSFLESFAATGLASVDPDPLVPDADLVCPRFDPLPPLP